MAYAQLLRLPNVFSAVADVTAGFLMVEGNLDRWQCYVPILLTSISLYLAGMVLKPGEDPWFVFRFVGTAGVLTYGTANILNGIWFGRKMVADIADGIAYGLITGAIFALLWPAATVVVG